MQFTPFSRQLMTYLIMLRALTSKEEVQVFLSLFEHLQLTKNILERANQSSFKTLLIPYCELQQEDLGKMRLCRSLILMLNIFHTKSFVDCLMKANLKEDQS